MRDIFNYKGKTIEERAEFFEHLARILFGFVVALIIICGALTVALNIK